MSPTEPSNRTRRFTRFVRIAFAMTLAILAFPARADAGFKYRIDPGTAEIANGANKWTLFTIYLDAAMGTNAVTLSDFSVKLTLTSTNDAGDVTGGVSFGAVDSAPSGAYVFSPLNSGADFTANLFDKGGALIDSRNSAGALTVTPGTTTTPRFESTDALSISVSDFADPYVTLDASTAAMSWKLGIFAIRNESISGGTVKVEFNQGFTSLNDDRGNNLVDANSFPDKPYSFKANGNGTVTSTPAPPSSVMALTGCACLFAARLRRRFLAAWCSVGVFEESRR